MKCILNIFLIFLKHSLANLEIKSTKIVPTKLSNNKVDYKMLERCLNNKIIYFIKICYFNDIHVL